MYDRSAVTALYIPRPEEEIFRAPVGKVVVVPKKYEKFPDECSNPFSMDFGKILSVVS